MPKRWHSKNTKHAFVYRTYRTACIKNGPPCGEPFTPPNVRLLFGLERTHMNLAASALRELDGAFAESEQRVVLAAADVLAGLEVSAALTNNDVASDNMLATVALHAEALCAGVATITSRT